MCKGIFCVVFLLTILNESQCIVTIPPFRQLDHNVQSGSVTILDNKTISISNFYYDGVGPEAYFWVGEGKPSRSGTAVPNEMGSTRPLSSYNGKNVKIRLPENITVESIDYLAVWCKRLEKSYGHVFMNERFSDENSTMVVPFVLKSFENPKYGLRSGPIAIDLERKIHVPHLHYNGNDSDIAFWVGKGRPSKNGTLLPSTYITKNRLTYSDELNVTINLSRNLTINDIDYIAVGSVYSKELFDSVYVQDYMNPNTVGFQLGVFIETHGLRSDPIILVNERTFFIPNLHFEGNGTDAHFWTGTADTPSQDGMLVPNEQDSKEPLSGYRGESVYVTLPGNVTVRDVNHLAVWSNVSKINFGHVFINKSNLKIPSSGKYPDITEDGRKIIRVPKCCSINSIVSHSSCNASDQPFKVNMDVHLSNKTHLNDVPMTKARIAFVPYLSNVNCPKYPLEPDIDNYTLLTNGKLLYLSERREIPLDGYCLDAVTLDNGKSYLHTVFVCVVDNSGPTAMNIVYGVCVFISALSFLAICTVYLALKKYTTLLSTCIILYAAFMFVAFLSLGISQFIGTETSCKYLDSLFHFSVIATFIFLNIYCYEIYYRARYYSKEDINNDSKRCLCLILGFVIPFIFVLSSVAAESTPGLTHYLDTTCNYIDGYKLPLYIPIILSICTSIGILIYTGIIIRNVISNPEKKVIWDYTENAITGIKLKRYHRKAIFAVSLMAMCWFLEVVCFYSGNSFVAFDVLIALQGLMACALFVYPEIQHIRRRGNVRSHQNGNLELAPMNTTINQ